MKKPLILPVAIAAAALAFFQPVQPDRPLAELMPSGALLYLEAKDFGHLLGEWNRSEVKTRWLASDNYQEFSRSNLLLKLQGLFQEYAAAATFSPDLKSALEVAGARSALSLYDLREVEFLYVTRLGEKQLAASQLWTVRAKFEQRQAAGMPFYVRRTPANQRAIAFAFAHGYLFVATRDDLVAHALELLAGGKEPGVASDRWYREPVRIRPEPGELRLALNLESLVASTYFRSYWIHRNASVLRTYWAGVADIERTPAAIIEKRLFLRSAAVDAIASDAERAALARLIALVPTTAGLYRGWAAPQPNDVATLILSRLLSPGIYVERDRRFAPQAAWFDGAAGSEADLETRIDEPPLPAASAGAVVPDPLRALLAAAKPEAALHIESSVRLAGQPFVTTPGALVVESAADWDAAAVREATARAVESLWTTSRLGAKWVQRDGFDQLDGLAKLSLAVRGRLLFIANDAALLNQVLNRMNQASTASAATYTAGFQHARERGNFDAFMQALDHSIPAPRREPAFFSENVGGLSRTLSAIGEVTVTAADSANQVEQTVVYRLR